MASHLRVFGVHLLRAKAVAAERDGRPDHALALFTEAVAPTIESPVELQWLANLVRWPPGTGRPRRPPPAASRRRLGTAGRPPPRRGGAGGVADADPAALKIINCGGDGLVTAGLPCGLPEA
jgi:hypothetical protein